MSQEGETLQLEKLTNVRLSLVDLHNVSLFNVFHWYRPRDRGCHEGEQRES